MNSLVRIWYCSWKIRNFSYQPLGNYLMVREHNVIMTAYSAVMLAFDFKTSIYKNILKVQEWVTINRQSPYSTSYSNKNSHAVHFYLGHNHINFYNGDMIFFYILVTSNKIFVGKCISPISYYYWIMLFTFTSFVY